MDEAIKKPDMLNVLNRSQGGAFFSALAVLVLCLLGTCVPGSARADIYLYIDSQGVLHFTNTPTSSDYKLYIKEKPKSTVKVASLRSFEQMIREAAARHGISASLIKALIKVESEFNPQAVSKKGALGLMQLMPENLASLQVEDPFNPRQNIMGGVRYLKTLLKRYRGRVPLALAAYNAGPSLVDRHQGIPPIKETEMFVEKVMKYFYLFKRKGS